jgi:uncharacterized protein with von Willebrand factor type A (vWA) domain
VSDYRYGSWRGGPDPLAPPFDLAGAVDRLGERVLDGATPSQALRDLLRRGMRRMRGLDDLLRRVRERQRELRDRGRLDGTLEQVRELLDQALEQERGALAADDSEAARLAEAELDTLPPETAGQVRQLADYRWRSPEAAATWQRIRDLLRSEVLDAQFRGMRQALANATPEDLARVRDMLADLNAMLDADARGEDTTEAFKDFMRRYGDLFPENPRNLEELVDALARRAAAASRMLASLTSSQRRELAELMAATLADIGLEHELDRLGRSLRSRRPDLPWDRGVRMGGEVPLGLGDATSALEELADTESLAQALSQNYPGASLDDVDRETLERALGHGAVDDLDQLRALERELTEQGFLTRERGEVSLTPKAIRRIGLAALNRIFRSLDAAAGRGDHDVAAAGAAGELTGSSRPWRFGDEQPLEVVATVRNAVRRQGPALLRAARAPGGPATPGRRDRPPRVPLALDDFEVAETERRVTAAVSLLVDMSYSMVLREAWPAAKATALALQSLVSTKYPQDALQVVGFASYARELRAADLPALGPSTLQGTNLQHALKLAGRHLARHADAEPVVLVITDGEPTAHLLPDGGFFFDWPPHPETVELTLAEVLRLTKRRATINVFMLDTAPGLVNFVESMARLNGGRVFTPATDRLGDYVVRDYLRARRGR